MSLTFKQLVAAIRLSTIARVNTKDGETNWAVVCTQGIDDIMTLADLVEPGAADLPVDQFFSKLTDRLPVIASDLADYIDRDVNPQAAKVRPMLKMAMDALTGE